MATFDAQLAGYESRFIDANGIKTHYIESGVGEPLILIHGGGPGADGYGNWQGCLPAFAQEYRALAVDMLGFGRTDKPDPSTFTYSQDARTNHMIAFIEALDTHPVSLIGNSMGGITSLGVAMQRPDLVKKLVLMGPAGIKTSEVPAALGPLMSYDGSVEGMRKVIDVLSESYSDRVVIFDSPPILSTSESRVLASSMGQIAMVVCAGGTPQQAVLEALEYLDDSKAINLILNQSASGLGSASYGAYRYGYGYGSVHR